MHIARTHFETNEMTSAYIMLIYVVACCSKSSAWKRIKSSDRVCQNCQFTKMINIAGGDRYASRNVVISALVLSCRPLKPSRRRAIHTEAFTRKCTRVQFENIFPFISRNFDWRLRYYSDASWESDASIIKRVKISFLLILILMMYSSVI